MDNSVKILQYSGPGFKPVWVFGSWRLAISNDSPASRRAGICALSKHLETDETFTLLSGKANIFSAGDGDRPGEIKKLTLAVGETAVVCKGVWHVAETFDGTKILIAENADTGPENSLKYPVCGNELP